MHDEIKHIDKKIVRTIARFTSFKLELNVSLLQPDGKSGVMDWERQVNSMWIEHSYYIENSVFLVIKNTSKNSDKDIDWRKRSLYMTSRTQPIFVKAFDDILRILYDEDHDPFYQEKGRLKTYTPEENQIVYVDNAGDDNIFELRPAVIVDKDNVEYEGAALSINTSENVGGLVLDELTAIRDILSKIDLFLYSQSLLNFYYIYRKKVEADHVVVKTQETRATKKRLFNPEDTEPKGEERVTSTGFSRNNDPFMGLKGEII